MPTTLGSVTTSKFEKSPEAHKLHNEFVVKTGQAAYEADPVIFATDGDVQSAGAGASAETVIGIAMMDVAADERVTISMKGYALVNALAGAALNAGPVELGAYDATTGKRKYVTATTAAKTVGHSLHVATADGDEIQVCILL